MEDGGPSRAGQCIGAGMVPANRMPPQAGRPRSSHSISHLTGGRGGAEVELCLAVASLAPPAPQAHPEE